MDSRGLRSGELDHARISHLSIRRSPEGISPLGSLVVSSSPGGWRWQHASVIGDFRDAAFLAELRIFDFRDPFIRERRSSRVLPVCCHRFRRDSPGGYAGTSAPHGCHSHRHIGIRILDAAITSLDSSGTIFHRGQQWPDPTHGSDRRSSVDTSRNTEFTHAPASSGASAIQTRPIESCYSPWALLKASTPSYRASFSMWTTSNFRSSRTWRRWSTSSCRIDRLLPCASKER